VSFSNLYKYAYPYFREERTEALAECKEEYEKYSSKFSKLRQEVSTIFFSFLCFSFIEIPCLLKKFASWIIFEDITHYPAYNNQDKLFKN